VDIDGGVEDLHHLRGVLRVWHPSKAMDDGKKGLVRGASGKAPETV